MHIPRSGERALIESGFTPMDMHETAMTSTPGPASGQGRTRLGERVRALRVAGGMTQVELAGGRFSKEYISQIERGKTRPTESTIALLAERLGVDQGFLVSGVSTEERTKVEAVLARAEALSEAHSYSEAIDTFREARSTVDGTWAAPTLELRILSGEAWALQQSGDINAALELLRQAREIAESAHFSDVDRADVLFRLGVCRYKLSSIGTAVALFDEALVLAEHSGLAL